MFDGLAEKFLVIVGVMVSQKLEVQGLRNCCISLKRFGAIQTGNAIFTEGFWIPEKETRVVKALWRDVMIEWKEARATRKK